MYRTFIQSFRLYSLWTVYDLQVFFPLFFFQIGYNCTVTLNSNFAILKPELFKSKIIIWVFSFVKIGDGFCSV